MGYMYGRFEGSSGRISGFGVSQISCTKARRTNRRNEQLRQKTSQLRGVHPSLGELALGVAYSR